MALPLLVQLRVTYWGGLGRELKVEYLNTAMWNNLNEHVYLNTAQCRQVLKSRGNLSQTDCCQSSTSLSAMHNNTCTHDAAYCCAHMQHKVCHIIVVIVRVTNQRQ